MAPKKEVQITPEGQNGFVLIKKDDAAQVEGWHFDQPGVLLKTTTASGITLEFKPGASIYPQVVDDKIIGGDLVGGGI